MVNGSWSHTVHGHIRFMVNGSRFMIDDGCMIQGHIRFMVTYGSGLMVHGS